MSSLTVVSRGGTWRYVVLAVLVVVTLPFGVPAASAATTGFGPVTQVALGSGETGTFGGISCTGSGDCTAVGTISNGGGVFYVTETNYIWSTPAPVPGTAGQDQIAPQVSCTSTGNCVAVGGIYYNAGGWYATETDGTWGTATMVTTSGYLTGVSCTADAYCAAAGFEGIGVGEPIVLTESGGAWSSPAEIPGSAGGQGWLDALSCTSTGNCTAVGHDNRDNGNSDQPIVITESAGTWGTPVDVPVSGIGGYGILGGVSCADAGDCAAVGWDGNSQPFYVTESAGTWAAPAEIPVSQGNGNLTGVDCVSAGNCIAVGAASGMPAYTITAAAPVIPCPAGTKANFRWHYSAGSGGGWSGTATQTCPGSLSMGPRAMDRHLKVAPGGTVQAGYDFTLPGNHDSLTMTVSAAKVTFAVRCASGATPSAGTFTVPMQAQSYQVTGDQWYPSGDQSSLLTYQGTATVPDLCGGGALDLAKGGTFTATLG